MIMPTLKQTAEYLQNFYKKGEDAGEFLADGVIALDHLNQMKDAGRKLVNMYGSGAGKDIDNYYHPLLQCQLAKISEKSRQNGLTLGRWKEDYWDYPKKVYIQKKPVKEVLADSEKDLQNNLYGSILGEENPYISCWELLDDRRTENMRKANIR